jgi:hypothetical protein
MEALTAPPHLDFRRNESALTNALIDQSGPQLFQDAPKISPDADTTVGYDASKALTSEVYEAAKAKSQPDQPMPEWLGLSGVDFYPISFTDTDGKMRKGSSIGRTNLVESLSGFYGPERANEQARNFIDRNGPNAPREDFAPNMHVRGGDAHFGRDIHVVRHSGPAQGNGHFAPGHDIGLWAKADDDTARINHEINGHGTMDAALFENGLVRNLRPVRNYDTWGQHLIHNPEDVFSNYLEKIADEHGYEVDPVTGDTDFLGPGIASTIYENLLKRYYTLPYEMRANGLNFKNRSLQSQGFRTLAEAGDETAFLRNSLLSDIQHPDDPKASGIHPTSTPEEFNRLLLMNKSIFHSMDKAGKMKWLNMMLRAGMLGAPVAIAAGQGEDK